MEAQLDTTEAWLEECIETATVRTTNPETVIPRSKDEHKENRIASKPHSTPLTLKWLEENYEIVEGVCIPRSTLYLHYLDFCEKNDSTPVNAASFGKIIRQQFPQITTRRLGTRGQSKYHYYGIGVRDSSEYYEVRFSREGVSHNTDGKKDNIKQIVAYSPRSKLGTLLPEFPNVKDLKLPPDAPEDKVTTFVMMYRTHCQRILDTVIRANFDEVQSFLLHFWQGMPQHIVPILGTTTIVNLVGVCDSILYKAISGVLMPTVLQALPDSLTQVIRKFAKTLDEWLKLALDGLPETLRKMKFDLARRFAQLLRRQTSLNHLCQASRTVIHSSDIIGQMLEDWANVDLCSICKQTLYTMDKYTDKDHDMIVSLYREFELLLEEQAPLEAYTEWIDSMISRCVVQPSSKKQGTLRRIARQFLLMWSCFGTRVIRDMTLHSAPSFGSFHLLHLMFDDYVLYQVENLHARERANDLLRSIKGEETMLEGQEELILPNPIMVTSTFSASLASSHTQGSAPDRQSVITDGREAFSMSTSGSTYAGSPQSTNSPPTPSSVPIHYDNRMDGHVTPMSPNNNNNNNNRPMSNPQSEAMQGDSNFHYGRYMSPVSSHTVAPAGNPSDVSPSYPYTFPTTNTQYSYYGRDGNAMPGREPSSGEWTDQQRYTHLQNANGGQAMTAGSYGTYGQGRTPEYDSSAYTYDANIYATNTRTHAQHGVIYQYYGTDNYYGNTNGNDADNVTRKRKQDSDDSRSNSQKRLPNEYTTPYMVTGGYPRA